MTVTEPEVQAAPWVCLIYHDVSGIHRDKVSGGSEYFAVSVAGFAQQLEIIRDLGYRGCSVAEALIPGGQPPIAISFDDGDLGQYQHAFPALAQRGMTATFFITTSWVGRPGYVSWEQLREMKAAGMSIQSHTRSHPFLSELDARGLQDELRASRLELDERLEQVTDSLALPGGDFPRSALRRLLYEEGYRVVATSRWGSNRIGSSSEPLYVKRCTVRGEPDRETFQRILAADPKVGRRRGVRDVVLRTLRATLGASRYAKIRRSVLNALGGG